jgi:anti-anti-sigma factor
MGRAEMNTRYSNNPLFQAVPLQRGRGLRLVGELDLSTVGDLRGMLATLPHGADVVTLDLADLSFMDSSGLRAVVEYAGTLNGSGPLVLDNVPGHIRRLLALTGVDGTPHIEVRGA